MSLRRVRVNERGQRIGEGHPKAVLSDADCERLVADRGPEDAPLASYSTLARRYGISKSSVRDILVGRRRGQIGPSVDRALPRRPVPIKVRVKVTITLHHRAKLRRLGGSHWLAQQLDNA